MIRPRYEIHKSQTTSPSIWAHPPYYDSVGKELAAVVQPLGLEPADVLLSGFCLDRRKAGTSRPITMHFNGFDGPPFKMPDAGQNNPIAFALRQANGGVGIYQRSRLDKIGLNKGAFGPDVCYCTAPASVLENTKVAELHLNNH